MLFLLLLFLVPAVLAMLVSFILSPVQVTLNVVQIVAFLAAAFFGFVAYYQGFFSSSSTLYFAVAAGTWLCLLFFRRPKTTPHY